MNHRRSSLPVRLRRSPDVARQRGAAMVEAVIVISFFLIALAGVVYFREMYVKKIASMRLSRAAVVQYSLAGCQGNPQAAVAPDMRGLTSTNTRSDEQVANGRDSRNEMPSSSEANSATRNIAGTNGFFLNPIANVGMRSTVSVGRVGNPIFQSTMASSSYASCPDRVRRHDQDFSEVVGYIGGLFGL